MLFRKTRLKRRARKIAREFTCYLKGKGYDAHPQWLGDLSIGEDFNFLVQTETDKERDRILSDDIIQNEFDRLVKIHRIMKGDFSNSNYGVESQETVNRDFEGDWRRATQ